MGSTNAPELQLVLDSDASLVLFELLSSRESEIVTTMRLDAAEQNALWLLEAALEKALVEPLSPDYESLLQRAKASLVERGGA